MSFKIISFFGAIFLTVCPILNANSLAPPVLEQEKTSEPTPAPIPAPDAEKKPASAPTTEEKIHTPIPTSYEGTFIKMLLSLGGLILAILATVWLLRKLGKGKFGGSGSTRLIRVVERRPLSPKSMLYLVEIGDRRVLIAESQLEIKRLSEWEELEEELE